LNQANPALSALITENIGKKWETNLKELAKLKNLVNDADFRNKWANVKTQNKARLAEYIKANCDVTVNPAALFDVQVKRIHEYKRQFMNILGVIHRYNMLKKMSATERAQEVPRVVIFGGKAAPGYFMAKMVIKLINSVAEVVNKDAFIGDALKVVYIADYNVSLAEIIIPASDISQHISTAGTEASGTSNMKFVLNGGLIVGTVDGANIEIAEEIGQENIFSFGALAHEVEDIRHAQVYRKTSIDPALNSVLETIKAGVFGHPKTFIPLLDTLTLGGDFYLLSADFSPYLNALKKADQEFKNKDGWVKKSILCTAGCGHFSSDRSVQEYAQRIWKIQPCVVPAVIEW